MKDPPVGWVAQIQVHLSNANGAERLARTLMPEATREVPRARTSVIRIGETSVEIRLFARDTSSLRAAVNTFLGWVELVAHTEKVAARTETSEALI